MKLTIIPDDSFVAVDNDGTHRPLDLTACNIPDEVHALQWFDTKGWIEFDDPIDPFAPKPPNEIIETLPQWALACVGVWEAWTPPAPFLFVEPLNLPNGQVGVPYSQVLNGVNGVAPYTITASGLLPEGLIIENNTLNGAPVAVGDYAIIVQITDSASNTRQSTLSLSIS